MAISIALNQDNQGALTRGADYTFGIRLTDKSSGTPVALNLTNHTAVATLSEDPGGTPVATFSTSLSGTDTLLMTLTDTQTAQLPLPLPDESGLRTLWVKVLVTRPDGIVLPGGEGPIEILP
jgi:hypothetical protein